MQNVEQTSRHMLRVFEVAHQHFDAMTSRPNRLTNLQEERLSQMFAHIEQNPEVIVLHTQRVEMAIDNFNKGHEGYNFEDIQKNSNEVSRGLRLGEQKLPKLGELGVEPDDSRHFLSIFTGRIEQGRYGFIEHIPASQNLLSHLTLAMIIDGHGLGSQMDLQTKKGILINEVPIVNAVCEQAGYELEVDLLAMNWIQVAWGFSPEYEKQFLERHS